MLIKYTCRGDVVAKPKKQSVNEGSAKQQIK
jgi:hypothetical protein